ncbi:uncharacterized protein LOC103714898 [Phoenix dactylifera]|uniref:Uncharacterized protein LOC103714898 n=1 Tax=Phoenix dactylifera TaxID=42345 RepID=A0A8B7CJH6_PHODC|nr:uncharacterized protein LOC103714898 [Phoenix dactylifera]XP_008800572.2 uncharacterized protein LOC103714898 [Phoenix dactylifera]XP_008800573.2 uncharacterized protein LOC103714898 [Phoenix dactylifera]XP_008800574.2 uncharacterized protein LOC103714898 [Phoenix dactylifera]XP_008800575.2 uncharacterized protein LOC103714898 [Phoenix dactylifera]XP_008800576.2 uncharacterized protein LOC103714898 [Phoenix dactylifera]XP_008800577.2 uncharacterized protein LOC103714898 [Phoenix dactylifer
MMDIKGSTSANVDDIRALLCKEWDEISCPICMDHPHNAVLLLCTCHEKGCKSYICDTSYRHSNCLDRFRKLSMDSMDGPSHSSSSMYDNTGRERHGRSTDAPASVPFFRDLRMTSNSTETHEDYGLEENNNRISAGSFEDSEGNDNILGPDRYLETQVEERITLNESGGEDRSEQNCLKCPLCRGMVMGWTIVKEARHYLDQKIRSCSQESCSFSGNYKELRRHARRVHPMTRPAYVDPSRQHAWRRLEHQQEFGDILSAIRSAMPGAFILGDYVIDNGDGLSHEHELGESNGPWWTTFLLFHMFSNPIRSFDEARGSSRAWRRHQRSSVQRNIWGENLLGQQDNGDENENLDTDDIRVPRRRRRFIRSRSDEQQL